MIESYPSDNGPDDFDKLQPILSAEHVSIEPAIYTSADEMEHLLQPTDAVLASKNSDNLNGMQENYNFLEDLKSKGELLTPREVAKIFRVDPKTVSRWANEVRLDCVRTLGGQRRFYESVIRAAIDKQSTTNNNPHNI